MLDRVQEQRNDQGNDYGDTDCDCTFVLIVTIDAGFNDEFKSVCPVGRMKKARRRFSVASFSFLVCFSFNVAFRVRQGLLRF